MKGWLANPPALFCVCAAAVALAAGGAVGFSSDPYFGFLIALWVVPFGVAGIVMVEAPYYARYSPLWKRIVEGRRVIETWAPAMGAAASVPCFALALVYAGQVKLLFLANLFWGTVCVSAGLLMRYIGVRRTLSLGCLMGAGMYMMAAVYFLERANALYVYFNLPWGLLFAAVAFAIDRGRNVAKEQASRKEDDAGA